MIPYLSVITVVLILLEIKYANKLIFRLLALLVIIVFIGIRFDVGADYLSYKDIFEQSKEWGNVLFIEPGYLFINQLIYVFSNKFFYLTILIATIQIVFVHLAIKDFKYYSFAFFVFLTMNLGSLVNEMRQYIAISIFFYSIQFIIDRSLIKYILCIILAATFHYSAVLLVPLYFVLNKEIRYNFYPIIYILALILSKLQLFDQLFTQLISYSSYSSYLDSDLIDKVHSSTGIGFLIKNTLGLVLLLCYKPMLKKFPEYVAYMNLYLYFLIARNLFFNIGILMRLTLYFQISEVIVYPLFLYAVFKKKFAPDAVIALSLIFLALFCMGISNAENHLSYQIVNLWR